MLKRFKGISVVSIKSLAVFSLEFGKRAEFGRSSDRLFGKAGFQLCLTVPRGSRDGLRECGGCSEELPEPIHPFPISHFPSGIACSATNTSLLINSPALIVRLFVALQSRCAEPQFPSPAGSCSLTLILGSSQGRELPAAPLLPWDVQQHLAGGGISAQPRTLHIWGSSAAPSGHARGKHGIGGIMGSRPGQG